MFIARKYRIWDHGHKDRFENKLLQYLKNHMETEVLPNRAGVHMFAKSELCYP